METLCKIREIYRAVSAFEGEMEKTYNLCLNEGMLLCSLSKTDKLSSGEIAESLGLTTSNTSKVIKSVEQREMRSHVIGSAGKRGVDFAVPPEGREALFVIAWRDIRLADWL